MVRSALLTCSCCDSRPFQDDCVQKLLWLARTSMPCRSGSDARLDTAVHGIAPHDSRWNSMSVHVKVLRPQQAVWPHQDLAGHYGRPGTYGCRRAQGAGRGLVVGGGKGESRTATLGMDTGAREPTARAWTRARREPLAAARRRRRVLAHLQAHKVPASHTMSHTHSGE